MELAATYTIVREIKSPSRKYGRLFEGRNRNTGASVLLKIVQKTEAKAIELLRNEASFSFSHSGLPKILDSYEDDDGLVLIRNYFSGNTLDKVWNEVKTRHKLTTLIEVFEALAQVYNELETAGVVHADLRPSNIVLSSEKQMDVAIIDFGLAIRHGKGTTESVQKRGTFFPLGYAAPELLLNHLSITDGRTDQFALGISIWRLFTDSLPLTHPNPGIYTNLQLTHALPDHQKLPRGLYRILRKMTNKYPFELPPNQYSEEQLVERLKNGMNDRYVNLEEVLADLRKIPLRRTFYQRISFR